MSINVSGNVISSTGFDTAGNILNNQNIITDGLVLWLDAGNNASYINSVGTGAGYYDCGYGCQYYASNPGCTNCNTQIKDMSGFGYDGTLQGATVAYSNIGGYINFNGSTNYVSDYIVPDSLWNSSSWTVSVWCNFTTVNKGSDNTMVGHGTTAINNGLHLVERSGYVYFGFYGNDLAGTILLTSGNWYNIVFTFNYSTKLKQIYVNSIFDNSSGTVGYGGTGSNTEFGRVFLSGYLYGEIPIIIINNKVLSAAEVLQNFNADRQRFGI